MSVIQPPYRPLQQFFRSGPLPCPYLDGRTERKLFTRLSGPLAPDINAALTKAGFRRSHDIVYRPVCPNCEACVPVRIPVAGFTPGRTLRRIARRNEDLSVTIVRAKATAEHFRVFHAYQRARHGDSEMSRMGMAEFSAMVDDGKVDTWLFEARDATGRFLGAMLTDRLDDGFSAIYSFFDPTEPRRSLGSWLILQLVEAAREVGLPHVYLGYWVGGSRKMDYKARFQPLEMLGRAGWVPMPSQPAPSRCSPQAD